MDKMTIEANVTKNRMYMDLVGLFSDNEIDELYSSFYHEVKKLHPGFDIITNISEFKPITHEGAYRMARARKLVRELGLNRMVRIVESDGSQTHVAHANKASSLAEAERMLDNAEQAIA